MQTTCDSSSTPALQNSISIQQALLKLLGIKLLETKWTIKLLGTSYYKLNTLLPSYLIQDYDDDFNSYHYSGIFRQIGCNNILLVNNTFRNLFCNLI